MSQKSVANALSIVMEKIAAAPFHERGLREMLPHELLPIIKASPALNNEYRRRVHYYETLAASVQYRDLHSKLHRAIAHLWLLVSKKDLPTKEVFWLPIKSLSKSWEKMSIEKFYDKLRTFQWVEIGGNHSSRTDAPDSFITPWRAALEQYEEVRRMFEVADVASSLSDDEGRYMKRLAVLIGEMTVLLQEPWHTLHIADFETVHVYVTKYSIQQGYEGRASRDLQSSDTQEQFKEAQSSAIVVCRDLLVELDKPKSRKWMSYDQRTHSFGYGNRQTQALCLPPDADYAVLCDAFYPNCPKSGRMNWEVVAQHIFKIVPNTNHQVDREKIREWVRSLNRWAIREKHFVSKILELDGADLVRLK